MDIKQNKYQELFDKAQDIKPMVEKDGQVYVNFDEASTLNSLNMLNEAKTGMQLRNRDGSIASTGKTVHAINPDYFFMNRYKVVGKPGNKKMLVVSGHEATGYRCIKEQEMGRIHIKTIPCYVFARNEDGELVIEKVSTVSDSEFISDFINTLTHKAYAEILPMITSYGTDRTADEMPI